MTEYVIGQTITLKAIFKDSDNTVVTPSSVLCRIKFPDGSSESGVASAADGGGYSYSFVTSKSGVHFFRFEASGSVVSSGESSFVVLKSNVI